MVAAALAGCALDEDAAETIELGDEIDESQLATTDALLDTAVEAAPEESLLGADDLQLAPDEAAQDTTLSAAVVTPAYWLFTRSGATCRDHCIARDEYLGTYNVGFSSPYYHYNNSKIYADYYIGQTRKQKWEQHRFAGAQVNVFCGSSGQYLYRYYGRAKRGREVVRTWICYAGRCRFQGDNYGSFHRGWNH